jgi:uncharacterized protein YlxW (UPF0749 family)
MNKIVLIIAMIVVYVGLKILIKTLVDSIRRHQKIKRIVTELDKINADMSYLEHQFVELHSSVDSARKIRAMADIEYKLNALGIALADLSNQLDKLKK